MKFKPTLVKSIVSLLGGIAVFFLTNELFSRPRECLPVPDNPDMMECFDFAPPDWALVFPVAALILIYVIWSLYQKN